jgi:choline dehydrogenase-like flavoprotein
MSASARLFVLAMGGIESARLLLASHPGGHGLGNSSDCVGRYYTCHLESVIGELRAHGVPVRFEFQRTNDGVYARRKIQITEGAQRRDSILNIAFRLHYPNISDAGHRSAILSAVFLAKRTLIPEYRRILQHSSVVSTSGSDLRKHLRNVALGVPELVCFTGTWISRRLLAQRKLPYVLVADPNNSYPIEFHSEQTPLRGSRVRLDDERDSFGVPRVRIAWRTCDADIRSIANAYRLLQNRLESLSWCRLQFDESRLWELASRSNPVGGHHIGTARMASTASAGVVDKDCAVFGLPNLYVASSAVFPTSSHANPTLTIVAMALRLATHLKKLAANQGPR